MITKKNTIKSLSFLIVSSVTTVFCLALSEDPPEITQLVYLLGRVLNIAVGVAGLVLVVMIAYGVWKSAMATGDPRGLEGAKQTWTFALYGFFIIVGASAAILIISSVLGINISPAGFLAGISSGLSSLINLSK